MARYAKALGDAVRSARLRLGYTQTDIAERIGVDVKTILNIEKYKGNPRTELLFLLIRELELDPIQIFYPEQYHTLDTTRRLKTLLSDCTEEEIKMIIPILEAILTSIRSQNSVIID